MCRDCRFREPPRRCGCRAGRIATIFAAVLAVLGPASGPVRADGIDEQLIKSAPALIDYLHKERVKTVGVLRFQVQRGNEQATFAAGPMNTNMVSRLENLVVLAADPKDRLELLREPGYVIASKKARLSYLNSTGRREMFKLTYPVLGGEGRTTTPDAFLSGLVQLSSDYQQTSVTVWAFTTQRPSLDPVLTFKVATDRNILADIGESFIISKRSLQGGEDLNRTAARTARLKKDTEDKGDNTNNEPIKVKPPKPPELSEYLQFQVEYNGEAQSITAGSGKTEKLGEPKEGQAVVMRIKNISDRRLGVILMVNGVSTIFEQEGELGAIRKWVLDPKEEYPIKGFYRKDKTVAPFKVVDSGLADEPMSPDKVGQIQVAVFDEEPEKDKKISRLRGVTEPDQRKTLPRTKEELLRAVEKRTQMKAGGRGIIVFDGEAPVLAKGVKEVDFTDARLIGVRTIVYLRADADKSSGNKGGKNKEDK